MSSKAPIPTFTFLQKIRLKLFGISKWDIPTYTTANELIKLYELSKALKEESVAVEIGSYIGASSLMVGLGLKNNCKLYCIDTWQNDAMTEGNWDTFKQFTTNTNLVKNKIAPIKSNSKDAVSQITTMVDFIFIDGDHSYEGVKTDFDLWFPKLKQGGVIVFHDWEWAEGVKRVINEDAKHQLSSFDELPNMFWGWKK